MKKLAWVALGFTLSLTTVAYAALPFPMGGAASYFSQAAADLRYLLLSGGTVTGQTTFTADPASTAVASTTLLANPATCATNEPLLGAAVAGSSRVKVDCEGDMTTAGNVTATANVLIGTVSGYGGIWLGATAATTPSTSNFSLLDDGLGNTLFASPNTLYFRTNGNADSANLTSTLFTSNSTFSAPRYLTATNCSSSAAPAVCATASAGSVVIAAAGTTVTVNTTRVSANSQILIQEDSGLGTKLGVTCNTTYARNYYVTARTAATSFTVTSSAAPVTNPACLSYFIVN